MKKIILILFGIAAVLFFVFMIPSAHAATLTPQEEQYLASLSALLHDLARLLEEFKSALIGTVQAQTASTTVSDPVVVPSVPTGLLISSSTALSIGLSWTGVPEFSYGILVDRDYRIERRLNSGSWSWIGSTAANVITYTDNNLAGAGMYDYRVKACNSGGCSVESSIITTTLPSQSSESAPTQITATAVNVGDYSSSLGGPTISPRAQFNYSVKTTTQSFNIYYKKAGDTTFTKYTFNANISANIFTYSQGTYLYRHTYPNSGWPLEWSWGGMPALSQSVQLGQYQAYVTATDNNGIEGAPSATASFEIYAEPTIVNPLNGSTVSGSTAPVFSISGNPASDYAYNSFAVSKKNVYGFVWWCCPWSTVGPFTSVQGPILEPDDDPYMLTVYSRRTQGGVDVSRPAVSILNVSTTQSSGDTQAPSTPTGISATAVSSSQINLSWSASTDAVGVTGYRIYRGSTQIATASTTAYSDTGLSAGTSYSYTVAAYDAAGNVSAQSASVSAATLTTTTTTATTTTITTAIDTTPPVISNIQVSIGPVVSGSYPRATIIWTTNEAADTEMDYYYGSPTGIPYVHLYTFTTSHSAATAELVTWATYYYRVASTDAAGNKTTSNWYALTVPTTTTTTATTTTTTTSTPTYQTTTTTTGETLIAATTTTATAPIIVFAIDGGKIFPQPGSIAVDATTRISVKFTKDIDPASLTAIFFTLVSAAAPSAPLSGSFTMVNDGFVFTPSAGLQPNTAYIYTVFQTIKDKSGIFLPSAFSATFTTGSSAASFLKTGEVIGKVTDGAGIPLAGATIYFSLHQDPSSSRNVTTDATGAYDVFLSEGAYRVEIFPPSGRADLLRPNPSLITVSGGQKHTLHLQFPAGSKLITGLILFSNAQVVSDVEVGAYSSESGQEARGTVDTKGRYALRVGGGKWQVGIRPKDPANAKWSYQGSFPVAYFSRDAIAETQIADFLVPVFDATIRVRAVDEIGNAIAGAGVALDTVSSAAAVVQETRAPPQFLKSDAAGLAAFTVRGGIYYIRGTTASEFGFMNPDEQAITIYTGEGKDVKLIFRKPSSVAPLTLSGITKLENGAPTDAFVWAWSEKGGFAKVRADAAGVFSMPLAPNARWHIGAGKEEGGVAYKASDVVLVVGSSPLSVEIILGKAKEIILQSVSASKPATETIVIQAPDGAKMTLPSFAAAGSGMVSVEVKQTVEAPSQAAAQVVSAVYDVTVRDTAGKTVTQLNDIAEIILPYKEEDLKAQGVSEDAIVPSFFDETVNAWVKIDNYTVDKDKNVVVARVKHLTRFAIVAAADITPPAAPTLVGASALGGGRIKISWVNPSRDFDHTKVYKSERAGALGEIFAAEVKGIEATDAAVRNGVTYYYTVRAVDPAGNESGNTNQTAVRAVGTSLSLLAQSAGTLSSGQAIKGAILRNLRQGSSGDDVKTLQSLLLKEGVYPEGLITGYFGNLTKQAVIRFQEKYRDEILAPIGLINGTGFVGKATRAKLQKLIGE